MAQAPKTIVVPSWLFPAIQAVVLATMAYGFSYVTDMGDKLEDVEKQQIRISIELDYIQQSTDRIEKKLEQM